MKQRTQLVNTCRLLHTLGLVSGSDGNVSLKLADNRLLLTPSRRHKGLLSEEELLITDYDGTVLQGSGRATSELPMHAFIYRERPEVGAIIHTHAPYCTAYACLGTGIPDDVLIEVPLLVGKVGTAPYQEPGTLALAHSIRPYIKDSNVILLQNHGIITFGESMEQALIYLEALENAAKSIATASLLGDVQRIPPEQVQKMYHR